MPKEMGDLKLPSLLCLLLLMPLFVPGSEAGKCHEYSKTYTGKASRCKHDPCVEACKKEGFTEGVCAMIRARPLFIRCFCKNKC
uniref:Knottin scorpion toxin-like domain-containing protein n=1 Tax=Hordeum vulgare subsp. vulgare TaxID=112509 RepID=A0A8I7B4C0_HORVV